ncbi:MULTISPECIES: TIGR04002 family protein [unclassified Clostridioides]|uniref:TIGR04002 family protein n=1 Tax=unclassified Clostridioides TaxID=2635829 RepID=UPI0006BBABF7|nr:TIGR04002 family protein [Clostridioides sp. ZZV14-6387]MCI9977800.1 TIGR04002 family protein [Clostridioides difficile]MDB3086752.1 TIGR04002 family protein [Clostridioides difficile]MDI0266343.1 TIGR04002 family protein [Clostridioides difficile]MDI7817386.1 TIGR04002 family protein [Clostridioides difficile]
MEKMNKVTSKKTTYIVTSALFASIICLTIAYILHIPVGGNNGYVHIGDAFIYLAATILPTNYAIAASAIGAGLADLSTGAAIWVIPTIIIKPILVLFFTSKSDKIINKRNIIASIIAGIVGLVLYMFAEGIIIGSFTSAFIMSLLGLLQPIGSFIVFIILGIALDKLDFKRRYFN